MKIKQGSNNPALLAFPKRDGVPVPNIDTATSIIFKMRGQNKPSVIVTGTMTVNDVPTAEIQYNWAAGDTDIVEDYDAEVIITFPGGVIEIHPNDGYELVSVVDAL